MRDVEHQRTGHNGMAQYRQQLDEIDAELIRLLGERRSVCREIAAYKTDNAIPMMQPSRVAEVLDRCATNASQAGVDPHLARKIFELVIRESCEMQTQLMRDREGTISAPGDRCAVVGGGAVGTLLATLLSAAGARVTVIDIRNSRLAGVDWLTCDARNLAPEAAVALSEADTVIVALPEDIAEAALADLVQHVSPRALFVDTLSVKLPFVTRANAVLSNEHLSINPMFRPSLGFPGQQVVVVHERPSGKRGEEFLAWIERLGAESVKLSATEHDRLVGGLQCLSHATILAFGNALTALGADAVAAEKLMAPPLRALFALLARVISGEPEVYWAIQAHNPFGNEVRQALECGMRTLSRWVHADGRHDFEQAFAELNRKCFSARRGDYAEYCAQLFAVPPPGGDLEIAFQSPAALDAPANQRTMKKGQIQ